MKKLFALAVLLLAFSAHAQGIGPGLWGRGGGGGLTAEQAAAIVLSSGGWSSNGTTTTTTLDVSMDGTAVSQQTVKSYAGLLFGNNIGTNNADIEAVSNNSTVHVGVRNSSNALVATMGSDGMIRASTTALAGFCAYSTSGTCYFPMFHDGPNEQLVLNQPLTVTTRTRDRSNDGFYANISVATPSFSHIASSDSITKRLIFSATAPTVTSACTSPTVTHGSTTSFQMDVGTSCTGISDVVLALPAATNGWSCHGYNKSTPTRALRQTADTTTSVTMSNYIQIGGSAGDFVDGDDLVISCTGR